MSAGKEKFALKITPEVKELVEAHYKQDGCGSRSQFIERAIQFYCGYLSAENSRDYLPNVVISAMQGTLGSLEDRMASLLFKNTVELSMVLHVIAATMNIPEDTLNALRGLCVEDVKKTHGSIRLEDAVRFQRG